MKNPYRSARQSFSLPPSTTERLLYLSSALILFAAFINFLFHNFPEDDVQINAVVKKSEFHKAHAPRIYNVVPQSSSNISSTSAAMKTATTKENFHNGFDEDDEVTSIHKEKKAAELSLTEKLSQKEIYEFRASTFEALLAQAFIKPKDNHDQESEEMNEYSDDDILLDDPSDSPFLQHIHNTSTPQGKAFQWILQSDALFRHSMDNLDDNPTIVQRYVLAVFFFSTGGRYDTSQSSSIGKHQVEQNLPKTLSWGKNGMLNFLSPAVHECYWNKLVILTKFGVKKCNSDMEITEIFLPEMNLVGTLPEELRFLDRLRVLDFQGNRLSGTLPVGLGKLNQLKYLALGNNNFEGTVPESMVHMMSLETFYLNYNNMHGYKTIPPSFCNLTRIGKLYNMWTDCRRIVDPIECSCCTVCCNALDSCGPNTVKSDDGNSLSAINIEKKMNQSYIINGDIGEVLVVVDEENEAYTSFLEGGDIVTVEEESKDNTHNTDSR